MADEKPYNDLPESDSERIEQSLARRLGINDDFFPSDEQVEQLVAQVNRRIDRQAVERPTPVTTLRWFRYVAAAAVLAVALGTAWIGFRSENGGFDRVAPELSYELLLAEAGDAEPMVWLLAGDEEIEALDEASVESLLYDYVAHDPMGAGDRLLDELSEDDWSYLYENMNTGDWL
jgi:hypothetical protein